MPRAKVKPQDRRRAVQACLSCKLSKIRCDAQSPCSACIRRGREDSCIYSGPHPSDSATSGPVEGQRNQPPQEPRSPISHSASCLSHTEVSHYNQDLDQSSPEVTQRAQETWRRSSNSTRSRMLTSSKGEKRMLRPNLFKPILTEISLRWSSIVALVSTVSATCCSTMHGSISIHGE